MRIIFLLLFSVSQALGAEVVLQADTTRLVAGQTVGVHLTIVDGK